MKNNCPNGHKLHVHGCESQDCIYTGWRSPGDWYLEEEARIIEQEVAIEESLGGDRE